MRGNTERMNGKTKGLCDRNNCFTCFTEERGLGLEENLRLSSLNGKKIVEGKCYATRIGRESIPGYASRKLAFTRELAEYGPTQQEPCQPKLVFPCPPPVYGWAD